MTVPRGRAGKAGHLAVAGHRGAQVGVPGRRLQPPDDHVLGIGRTPDGNAVALDEQLVKLADTETTHAMVTSIYRKYLGMFSMALGRGSAG